ncbi:MAG: undecaprenyl-phosphate glucose phosphotransferase [Gammaproteobacteria bacterium]|nr:undecaprenyl-phosphate glucose phosphotransferase [Gammaproteobacteria bacterium]
MTAVQSVVPWAIAMASWVALMAVYGLPFYPDRIELLVVAVLCLVLIEPPRDVTMQLASASLPAATGIIARWLLLLTGLFVVHFLGGILADFPRRFVWTWLLLTPFLLIGALLLMQTLMRRQLMRASGLRRAVFAGYNETSLMLAHRIRDYPVMCLAVDGFFDDRSANRLQLDVETELRGSLTDLVSYVNSHRTDIIFVALPIRHVRRVMTLLDELRDTTASIYYVPDIFVFDLIQARAGDIRGMPVVALCETPLYGYRGVSKRITDVVLASGLVLGLSPVLLAIALLVKLSSPGPVIFKQRRYGLDGREIAVYKFRSMTVTEDGGAIAQASRGDARITPIGRVLRRLSLDELPQLFNVLQGRMSLVGPRPHAVAHNEMYRKLIKGYMVRHKVLPGITGLAQVSGCRGETARLEDMEARVRYDLDYLRHWTPMLDFKILLLTAIKLFRDDQAY